MFKLASANFSGLGLWKRNLIDNLLHGRSLDVLNIQETHLKAGDTWGVKYFKAYFSDFLVYTSEAAQGDNGAGVATLIRKSPLWKVLQFNVLQQGRLTNTVMEHREFGIINVINWYG